MSDLAVSSDTSASDWDAYIAAHPAATRYHPWAWRGVFERAFGHQTIYLAGRREGVIVGVLPLVSFRSLLFGRFLVSLPFVNYGGVLADDEDAASALLAHAREEATLRRAAHVELRHTRRVFPALPVRQHKVAMTMPLAPDEEAAWKGFDNKLRNAIRKAQKGGLQEVIGGAELLDDFYAVFARNMRDLGTPVYPRRFFAEVVAAVPDVRIYSIRRDRAPVAAAITIGYADAVENPWASSLREHRALNPNMLLYWLMIRDAVARGYRVFDFGRSSPGEGTYQFKKQWGAVESPFYWEYAIAEGKPLPDLSPKSSKLSAAVSVWRRLPLRIANVLGPRVVRNIP